MFVLFVTYINICMIFFFFFLTILYNYTVFKGRHQIGCGKN